MINAITRIPIFAFLLSAGCVENNSSLRFEENISYRNIGDEFRTIADEFDESVIYLQSNDVELQREFMVLGKKNERWHKALYHVKIATDHPKVTKVGQKTLDRDDALIIQHYLAEYHLFDIPTQDVLLEEHEKLCGKPRDPSHYLAYTVVMVSGSGVRQIYYGNPHGRFELCPAIKNWQHAAKISEIFNSEWKEIGHSGNFGPPASTY